MEREIYEESALDANGVYELRNAIILQAAYDYEKALRKLARYPREYQDWTEDLLHTYIDRTPLGELEKYFDAGMEIEIGMSFPPLWREDLEFHGWWWNRYPWSKGHTGVVTFRELQGKFWRDIWNVRDAQRMVKDCEEFFRGDWYRLICNIDGEWMIRKIREQSKEKRGNFFKDSNTKELQRKMEKRHDIYWADIERDLSKSLHRSNKGKRGKGK